MKKLKSFILAAIMLFMCFSCVFTFGGCNDRSETLRLYVPGEYIPDETLDGFEEWYYEVTGKTINVVKKEFDTNETMYTMVATKKQDFDVICPSDYMVERLKNEGLLVKLNNETLDNTITLEDGTEYLGVRQNILGENNENENLVNLIKSYDPNFEYATPYMWGTMGIMYYYGGDQENVADVNAADYLKSTWKSLFDVSTKKIYMKDSERDCYTIALFNYYYNNLKSASQNFTNFETAEYQSLLNEIFTLGTNFEEKLEFAKTTLTNQKQYVYDYETDEGKDDLLTSKGAQGYYGMFWSCDAGYIMADWSGEDVVYNQNFRYIVPTEGSNVWIDSFCIPKYAGNKPAANLFMQYISNPDVSFDCMDYAGCTSATYQTTVDYYDYLMDEEESPIFNECSEAFKAMYLALMFPHLDIQTDNYTFKSPLKKCGIMRDLGSKASDSLLVMWAKLRREINF